ncbi:hypothetical protein L6R52_02035 [Myxococcota bacterium]|nr:hypothetical protein [Myxococcota bacterium]
MNDKLFDRLPRWALARTLAASVLGAALLAPALTASAAPVVGAGKKPGVAASWSSAGGAVTLKIVQGYDAAEVASAIAAAVKGASAKAQGSDVVVTGLAEADLITALEKVDVKEAASGDDVDAMLANLQKPGGEEEGSGSSIRATQQTDFSEVLGDKTEIIGAKVVSVDRRKFPLVIVTVKLDKVPKGLAGPGLKSGATLKVLPRVKSKNGIVDPNDQASTLNVGAWYAQPGDKVQLRLEKEPKDGVWVAAAFNRNAK